jgi:hypothetical protein
MQRSKRQCGHNLRSLSCLGVSTLVNTEIGMSASTPLNTAQPNTHAHA